MVIKRREFLQVGSLATASLLVPKFLKAFEGINMVPPGNAVLQTQVTLFLLAQRIQSLRSRLR